MLYSSNNSIYFDKITNNHSFNMIKITTFLKYDFNHILSKSKLF